MMRIMVKAVADMNHPDNAGNIALHNSMLGHSTIVLQEYFKAHAVNQPRLAISYEVSRSKYIEILRILIDAGADVNRVDKEGKSPLYTAVLQNNADAVS